MLTLTSSLNDTESTRGILTFEEAWTHIQHFHILTYRTACRAGKSKSQAYKCVLNFKWTYLKASKQKLFDGLFFPAQWVMTVYFRREETSLVPPLFRLPFWRAVIMDRAGALVSAILEQMSSQMAGAHRYIDTALWSRVKSACTHATFSLSSELSSLCFVVLMYLVPLWSLKAWKTVFFFFLVEAWRCIQYQHQRAPKLFLALYI